MTIYFGGIKDIRVSQITRYLYNEVLIFPDEKETSVKIISICNTETTNIEEIKNYVYKKYENYRVHRGLGDEIVNGVNGDLSVEVVIQRHPHFKLEGKNLIFEPKVSIVDIMLGKSIEIPYFQKTNLNTDIPQNSGINSQFTLRGKGLAGGHLIVRPLIHMPNKLSGEDRELLMKISSSDSFKIEK